MNEIVLIGTVLGVGVLHTLVPDHWAPIAVLARAQGWTRRRTAQAAAVAGFGHVTSTLVLGAAVWAIGASAAAHYGHLVDRIAAVALIAFGLWVAWGGWREAREGEAHQHLGHAHAHEHGDGTRHAHWHEHHAGDWHMQGDGTVAIHTHDHGVSGRTALLLILGSSPMIEGLPAFFAASAFGPALLALMAAVFAIATIATYVVVSVTAVSGLERLSFGPIERYGEALSGALVALVGVYSFFYL